MEQNQDYSQPASVPSPGGPSQPAATPAAAFTLKSGMYWRKSQLFGWLCPPGILTLSGGRVRFATATETVFDEAVTDTAAAFSGWGTLSITAAGTRYDFVGTAGAASKAFTAAQQEELGRAARGMDLSAVGVGLAGAGVVAGAALGQLAGTGILLGQYASGVNVLKVWPAALQEAGAQVTATKPNYMAWFYGILFGGLAVAAGIAVIVQL
jgi:hypothetical protein